MNESHPEDHSIIPVCPHLRRPLASCCNFHAQSPALSGTSFLASLLQRLGLHVSHDNKKVRTDGAVAWPLAFNAQPHGGGVCMFPRFAHPLRGPMDSEHQARPRAETEPRLSCALAKPLRLLDRR